MIAEKEYIPVSAAKKRFLGGTMSLRWWYRQIEDGRLVHYRAGKSVRLLVSDVEAFVAEMLREKAKPADDESPPVPVAAASSRSSKRGGLRFFN